MIADAAEFHLLESSKEEACNVGQYDPVSGFWWPTGGGWVGLMRGSVSGITRETTGYYHHVEDGAGPGRSRRKTRDKCIAMLLVILARYPPSVSLPCGILARAAAAQTTCADLGD